MLKSPAIPNDSSFTSFCTSRYLASTHHPLRMSRHITFLLFFLAASLPGLSQSHTAACCMRPTAAFAGLASNADFVSAHAEPIPFQYDGTGESITFPVPGGGPEGRGFLIRSNTGSSDKYLLVIQEWWGLNDYIKREAARYARELPGVNVLAVDLYDGAVATTREEASRLVQAVKTERAEAILRGAATLAGPRASIATVGWCFGGGWSLQAALLNGRQAAGCVMFYGMPETSPVRLASLQTPVLGIFATRDKHITPRIVNDFEEAMKKAGKQLTVKNYDADHAFANPSNPGYAEQYANDATARAVAFLKKELDVR